MNIEFLDNAIESFLSTEIGTEYINSTLFEKRKKEMLEYASKRKNESLAPMKYLYSEKDTEEASAIISLIAQAIALKNFSTIDGERISQQKALEDYSSIAQTIYLLAAFTVLVNSNFSENDFQRLCRESMDCYRSNWKRRMKNFWKDLSNWQKLFEGCLYF